MSSAPLITLNNGATIPQLGLGVWQLDNAQAEASCLTALQDGYRHIDTAMIYGNEEGVGKALKRTEVPRDQIFVTTKVWNADQGFDTTLRAFDTSLAKLQLSALDLYLIHWPLPKRDKYLDTWRALIRLQEEGRVKAIGVCNFNAEHLDRLIAETGFAPAVNQIELHPDFSQPALGSFCRSKGIAVQAWSPLGQGGELLKSPVLQKLAARHGKSAAQIVLRWHLQQGNIVIPRSQNPGRIKENFAVFDFELTEADLAAIAQMPQADRLGPDPETFDMA